jgi:hypothetical protein
MWITSWVWTTTFFISFSVIGVVVVSVDSIQGCAATEEELVRLVSSGDLSTARWTALELLSQHPECQRAVQETYKGTFDKIFLQVGDDYLQRISKHLRHHAGAVWKPAAKEDRDECISAVVVPSEETMASDPTNEWDKCCSILPKKKPEVAPEASVFSDSFSSGSAEGCVTTNPCCEFYVGSSSHLRLPALHEPALRLRISLGNSNKKEVVLELEQDGYLRVFDVAGILWPSGYLLTLCVANPIGCEIPEVHQAIDQHRASISPAAPIAVELGTGVGAPSIAFALHLREYHGRDSSHTGPLVVSTDIAPQALALTIANAWSNDVNLATVRMDHANVTSIVEAKKRFFPHQDRGFSLVMGSSLQTIFRDTQDPNSMLWTTLEILLDKNNSKALAVFVHTRTDRLEAPEDNSFTLLRRISGDIFGLKTRSGDSSDFEISIFRRSRQVPSMREL